MKPHFILAGVYISERIVNYITGARVEVARKKEESLRKRIDEYTQSSLDSKLGNTSHNTIESCFNTLYNSATEEYESTDDFIKEIIATRKNARDCLYGKNNEVHTPLRRSSLELLIRLLSEAIERLKAYQQYLAVYKKIIYRDRENTEIPTYSMILPRDYPYIGKVIWIDEATIVDGKIVIETALTQLTIVVDDLEQLNFTETTHVPVMITDLDMQKPSFVASVECGEFKVNELACTHLGFSAKVKKIYKNYLLLIYKDRLTLKLPKQNLIDPNRFPPIRSEVVVYPVKWEFSLKSPNRVDGEKNPPVVVSEKKDDVISSFAFEGIPICFTSEQYEQFIRFYIEHELSERENEEYIIGLYENTWIGLHAGQKLKIQLGDLPLFVVLIKPQEQQSGKFGYYLCFDHLCATDEKPFSPDDVFVPFDTSIIPYTTGISEEKLKHYTEIDDLNDVSTYIWDITEELRIQDRIKKIRKGIGFFFNWESVTGQLISELEKGDCFQLNVNWYPGNERYRICAEIENTEELAVFLQESYCKLESEIKSVYRPQFFVEDEKRNRFSAFINDKILEIVGGDVSAVFNGCSNSINLYIQNVPYAEYQQISAMRQFRRGQVVNTKIQAACLDSSSVVPDTTEVTTLTSFFNHNITQNASQRQIVERALNEKNIFFIQGPPGTGKTTVIRELVEQALCASPLSRILIVSQANIAVDNAIKGLVNKYNKDIVRCGNSDKIAEDHQELRLDYRCLEYLEELKLRKNDFPKEFYDDWERKVLPDKYGNYLPALYELILRSHRIIGATCVGLSRKKIGLDRTTFDLVIIDEAGKALPAEMLIPLLRAKKAIIIGDQKQLPPVINPLLYDAEKIDLEDRAVSENELFEHSFFERLFENAPDACKGMLDTQYRMPAVIGSVISDLFYDGKLKNGPDTEFRQPVLFSSNFSFIDFCKCADYKEEKDEENSVINRKEAFEAFKLVNRIKQKEPDCTIAVITPYKGQKRLIRETFERHKINISNRKIEIDTVDSFQGSEADVVVFCTTRARKPTPFFRDSKRINVALSRPRRELIILGNLQYFYKYGRDSSCLPALADYIRNNGNIVRMN
jgi:hypothetical protein